MQRLERDGDVVELEGGRGEPGRGALTARQAQVLAYIGECIEARGFPPTLREIGERLSIRSTNGVNDHLRALERKGYLERELWKSRALRPVGTTSVVSVPLLGQVAAGQPQLAVEQSDTSIKVDRSLLGSAPPGEVFALRVRGDSMIEDGILDSDYVFVRRQPTARAGQTVVALIDDEATVKRYYPDGDELRFQPANAAMAPIVVHSGEGRAVQLLGVVVGVYRRL
ncbi:MAG: transcriptional repressor LexA [Proteobacteria bacterium]|nr:transcriptional repressor LexA [Pseudomonadota bacterium]